LANILKRHAEWLKDGGLYDHELANDPRRTNLCGAYLADADLTGAHLEGAHLEGAYLDGADLTGEDGVGGATEQKTGLSSHDVSPLW
jgi:uncharacterized protein YjbI with pentapeptide repeats